MWNDYYLKATDLEAFAQSLPDAWREAPYGAGYALDAVGEIAHGGEWNEDTQEFSEILPVAGYHANLRLRQGNALPAALEVWRIEPPAHPKRVFA